MELYGLVEVMNEVADSIQLPMELDEALERITTSAAESVPGIDYVSISVTTKDGEIRTVAPTAHIAVQADELQYELGEGPCLDAVTREPVVQVDDLATDLRWPKYGPMAAGLGLGSQLGFQFRADPHARGALNLYAEEPHQIDVETRQLAGMFARLAAIKLGWDRERSSLQEALATRSTIGQATGIIMERHGLDFEQAFAFLVRTSQTGNIKLRDVASGLVADTVKRTR